MKIGILGGGQLARMLVTAGLPLGLTFRIYSDRQDESTAGFADLHYGSYDDAEALARFANGLDCLTFEFENLSIKGLQALQNLVKVSPSIRALAVGQDREQEKSLFRALQIPTTEFEIAVDRAQLNEILARRPRPLVIKTTRMGYDGKGQCVLRSDALTTEAEKLGTLGSGPYLVENLVPFDSEVSIIGVRSQSGEIRTYSLTDNIHHSGILWRSIAPTRSSIGKNLESKAQQYFKLIAEELQYCGVLAIEFFVVGDTLVANEIAPRVHNTGHWTIDGAVTSQFENHLRAVAGLPLGSTAAKGHSVMINLIGALPAISPILECDLAHLHLYGKSARPGRKLGHVTLCGTDPDVVLNRSKLLFGTGV
jgi:5-(carboxyamino)imidazole ribonucleotide synthase